MKKKIMYPLLAGIFILISILLLGSMTKRTIKPKRPLTGVTLTVVNNTSVSWTEIDITDSLGNFNRYYPSSLPCTCYPMSSNNKVTVYFSSSMTGAIEIVDADFNTLGCSASGDYYPARTLTPCLGSSTSAEIDIYTTHFCP